MSGKKKNRREDAKLQKLIFAAAILELAKAVIDLIERLIE